MAVQVQRIEWRAEAAAKVAVSSPMLPRLDVKASASMVGQASITVFPRARMVAELYFSIDNGTKSQRVSAMSQSLEVENLIELWEMDLSHMSMGIIRFAPDVGGGLQPLRFGGNTYYPWPIAVEGLERGVDGAPARPTLRAGAVTPEMTSLLIGAEGLQGSKVTRIRTFRRFLDDGAEPSTTNIFPLEVFRIERMAEWISGVGVTLELANPLDLENALFPKRQIIRDYCSWRYRRWNFDKQAFSYSSIAPCPYAGGACFDQMGKAVPSHQDRCAKTITACALRFGENAVLPFAGFPGAAPLGR